MRRPLVPQASILAVLHHPNFDPVIFSIGPLAFRWYGLMYVIGFVIFIVLGRLRAREAWRGMSGNDVEDLLFYGVVGVIVGGRLGHVLFYEPQMLWTDPLQVFAIWKGGMASHGGILGVTAAMWLFAHNRGKSFLSVADFVMPLTPLGLAAGRVGNFINGELWGRVADPSVVPWAMIFPDPRAGNLPRHPSQLYQALLEGVLLFVILWLLSRKQRAPGVIGAAFLIGYGLLRIVAEFFREPETLYGTMPLGLSAGQWLSVPMVALGLGLMFYFTRRSPTAPASDQRAK
jgi:phosphatidylglycerol:prolipoprotein diacylglycerol transferase